MHQIPGPFPVRPPIQPYQPPKRDNKLLWITLGSVLAFLLLLCVGVFVLGSSLNSKEQEKVAKIESIASRIVPAEDWTERNLRKPKVDPGCLPIDTTCHRWEQSWATDGYVSLDDIEDQLGIPLSGISGGHCRSGEEDGVKVKICAFNEDKPQFNLFLED
jgi:hypothetical protein